MKTHLACKTPPNPMLSPQRQPKTSRAVQAKNAEGGRSMREKSIENRNKKFGQIHRCQWLAGISSLSHALGLARTIANSITSGASCAALDLAPDLLGLAGRPGPGLAEAILGPVPDALARGPVALPSARASAGSGFFSGDVDPDGGFGRVVADGDGVYPEGLGRLGDRRWCRC